MHVAFDLTCILFFQNIRGTNALIQLGGLDAGGVARLGMPGALWAVLEFGGSRTAKLSCVNDQRPAWLLQLWLSLGCRRAPVLWGLSAPMRCFLGGDMVASIGRGSKTLMVATTVRR